VNKARSIKLIYIIAALALLVGMIPMTAVPVSAAGPAISVSLVDPTNANNTIPEPNPAYNVSTATIMVSVTGLENVTITSWAKTDIVPGTNSAWVGVDPNTITPIPTSVKLNGVWGETVISATLSNGTVLTADKKWGQIASTFFSNQTGTNSPSGSSYVTWVEAAKSFIGNVSFTDNVVGNFKDKETPPNITTHAAQGAVLNWFLIDGTADLSRLTPGEAPDLLKKINGGTVGTVTYTALPRARFARFDNLQNGTDKITVSNASGQSTVNIVTNGEEGIQIVVIPQYPLSVLVQIPVVPEVTTWNFMTREMEVVPQVRWAGEKIVLEKNFGAVFHPSSVTNNPLYLVRFSTTTPNAVLEAFGNTYIPLGGGNFSNSSQTVWTTVQSTGLASVILYFADQGVVNVVATLYELYQGNDQRLVVLNQHAFTVYYMKFESLTLNNVSGKRSGHNSGNWVPPNPFNTATDLPTGNPNVSQDELLRAQVKGWFTSSNPTMRPEGFVDIGGNFPLSLPVGRWVLPDDWASLAGPTNWTNYRIHWDIMSSPDDAKTFSIVNNEKGKYVQGTKTVADYPVIGPFSPGIELMTDTGWALKSVVPSPDPLRQISTVVPNGNLDAWDAPMPPAKIIFEIMSGNGYFKSAFKTDIYYLWSTPATTPPSKIYTNPFYWEMIPAHEAIPAFLNNGGYDWDSFNTAYGPYQFWKVINQPNGVVSTADQSGHPTKVEAYSDNHGEAMVYLNGNWNLNLTQFLSNGAADVMNGAPVGTTVVDAFADYPYFRNHQAIYSAGNVPAEVTKFWTWGGLVLGPDTSHPFPPTNATYGSLYPSMILSTGTYFIQGGTFPNEWGTSDKKMVFVWVTDRDGKQTGVLGAKVEWNIATASGSVPIISGMNTTIGAGVSNYNEVTQNIELTGGFLTGTNGSLIGSMDGHQGVSYLKRPQDSFVLTQNSTNPLDPTQPNYKGKTVLEALFYKFFNPTMVATGLQPDDFAVAAIEVRNVGGSTTFGDFNVSELITSADFGMQPGQVGTVMYNTNVMPSIGYAIDDAPKYGDANVDGSINMGDVTKIERIILGLDPANINADANHNASIDMGDVVKVERTILGLK